MRGACTTFLLMLSLAVFLAAALCFTSSARADGKVFAVEVADVSGAQIPDQAALICWDPTTKLQTLAIETRFIGKGTEFGWVVPLPSRPEVTPGTTGMFPSLRGMFAPVVQRDAGFKVTIIAILLIVATLLLLYFPLKRAVAIGCGVSLLVYLLMPAVGKPRGMPDIPIAEPEFVDRRIVGEFEVTTLESSDGSVVVNWLRAHNFFVPAAAEQAIDQYAKEKWSFVATRLAREADSAEASTAHPLVFTFVTESPVYPMRLTGADATRDLSVELFVFGPSMATAPGFAVVSAGPVQHFGPDHRWVLPSPDQINVAHRALRPLTSSSQFATRLAATLTPAQMTRDVPIGWSVGGATGRSVYGAGAVAGLALASACVTGFFALVGIGLVERRRGWIKGTAIVGAIVAAVSCWWIIVAMVPSVPGERVLGGRSPVEEALFEVQDELADLKTTVTLREACELLDAFLDQYNANHGTNIQRGDAPGQLDVRARYGFIELVGVNIVGVEVNNHVLLYLTDDEDSEP